MQMANPQPDKYTKISNELIEKALCRTNFSSYQSRIVWAIFRKTYGWDKTSDWISNSQLVEMTGITKQNVSRTLKELKERNIIVREGYMTSFQKDYDQWIELSRKTTKLSKETTVINPDNLVVDTDNTVINPDNEVINPDNEVISIEAHKRTYTKETITKESIAHFFEECWKSYPRKEGKGKVTDKAKRRSFEMGDEFKRCIKRYIETVENDRKKDFKERNWQHGSTFWNSGYLDFTDENYQEQPQGPVTPKQQVLNIPDVTTYKTDKQKKQEQQEELERMIMEAENGQS